MRYAFAFVLLTLAATPANAQAVPSDLASALQAREAAAGNGDGETWSRYTADDFLGTNADGVVDTKSVRLAQVKTRKGGGTPKKSDERWRVYGDTAIGTWRNDNAEGSVRTTQVWIKQGGQWRVVSAQQTRVTK